MGFDADGRITGMHCRVLGDAGAYAGFGGALAMGPTRMMAQGVYRIPAIRYDVAVAVTNTTPMGAFRGAGRPEAAEFLERMMDLAAAELQIDPVELRRRNLLPAFNDAGTNRHGYDLRHRRLPEGPRRGRASRPATRTCEPSRPDGGRPETGGSSASACPSTSRSPPAGAARSSGRSRSTETARPPSGWAPRRTGRATPPPSP